MLYPLTRMMWVDEQPKKVAVGGGSYQYHPDTQSVVKYAKYVDVVGSIYKNYMFITSVHSRLLQKYRLFVPVVGNVYIEFLRNFSIKSNLFKEFTYNIGVKSTIFDLGVLKNIEKLKKIDNFKKIRTISSIDNVKFINYFKNIEQIKSTMFVKNSVLIDDLDKIRRKELFDLFKNN